MADLHPFFVHFPIALLIVAAGFDTFGAIASRQPHHRTAYSIQVIAGLFALLAAFTGNQAETRLLEQPELHQVVLTVFDRHVSLGNAMIWIIIILAVGRTFAILERKSWGLGGWVFPLMSILVAGLILGTGLLGGELSREILNFYKSP